MPRDWTHEQRRRADEEEEQHYWESVEAERLAEEERQAAEEATIAAIETWFFEQFEDPQKQMPWDNETDSYLYPYGGPFEASYILHSVFSGEHSEEAIRAAIDRIEGDGSVEWAPRVGGEYYEPPADEESNLGETRALVENALERLAALEAILQDVPVDSTKLGHNRPPEAIGIPPYREKDAEEVAQAISATREVLSAPEPSAAEVKTLAERFKRLGEKFGLWAAKKGDLAVDELIKNSIRVVTWTNAVAAVGLVVEALVQLAKHL